MKGILTNIQKEVEQNKNFRRVMYTGKFLQLVKMSLKPGEDVGDETHPVDQFFRVEKGSGVIRIDDVDHDFKDGDAALVPAGTEHNISNTGKEDMKFYTIYGPPNHQDGLSQPTKKDQDKDFDGDTTESGSKKEILKKIIKK